MRHRRVVFAAIACATAGCDLIYPLQDYAGNPLTTMSMDSGADVRDGAVTAPPAEAGDAAADALQPFCQSNPDATFCADFDNPADTVDYGFTSIQLDGKGSVAKTTTAFVSSPFALLSHSEPDPADYATARLIKMFSPKATRSHVAFSLRMDTPTLPTNGAASTTLRISTAEILCFQTDGSKYDGAWLFWVTQSQNRFFGLVTNQGGTFTSVAAPRGDAWTRYEIDAHWGTSSVDVIVDGATTASVKIPTACSSFEAAEITIGISGFPGSPISEADYDNIRYDEEDP